MVTENKTNHEPEIGLHDAELSNDIGSFRIFLHFKETPIPHSSALIHNKIGFTFRSVSRAAL